MDHLEDLRINLSLEIRENSKSNNYLEAVVKSSEIEKLSAILSKHFGQASSGNAKGARDTRRVDGIIKSLGGIRSGQTFYYREDAERVAFAALWPWESDSSRVTLKTGWA